MLPRLSVTVGVMLRYALHDTLLFKLPQVGYLLLPCGPGVHALLEHGQRHGPVEQ